MPASPRPKGKATKIFYEVLGKPETANKSEQQKKIDKRLIFEETIRAR